MGPLVVLLCGGVIYTDDNTIKIPSADIGLLPLFLFGEGGNVSSMNKPITKYIHASVYYYMYMYVQVHVDQNIPTSLFTCPSL
jgi:hypothetical protein